VEAVSGWHYRTLLIAKAFLHVTSRLVAERCSK
jgi:hypothetical protein